MTSSLPATLALGTPLVSVVVPCYGEGRYLDDCLWSLRHQHYGHLEIIVIDDAGEDDSVAVALDHASQDDRVRVVRARANVGLGAVRNIALDGVRGEVVTFVDGDDLLPPRSIAARVAALAAHLRATDPDDRHRIVGSYGDWRYATATIVGAPDAALARPLVPIDLAASAGGNVFIVSAPLVRTDALRAAGGFAEGVGGGEDYIAWMRVLAGGGVFVPCPEVVAVYRQKAGSMVRTSAGEYAALAAAGRGWVDEAVNALPSMPGRWPALDDLRAGESTIEFGTVVDRGPTVAALPTAPTGTTIGPTPWPSTAPEGPRPPSPVAARIVAGAALLRSANPGHRFGVDVFHLIGAAATGRGLMIARHDALPPMPAARSHDTPTAIVRADSLFGGMVAAAIVVLAPRVDALRLELTPPARSGALRLFAAVGMPDGLVLAPAADRFCPTATTLASVTTGDMHRDITLEATAEVPDGLTLVAAALADVAVAHGPRHLVVMGPGGDDPVAWFADALRALPGGDTDTGHRDAILATTDARTARHCADAGVAVRVITLRLISMATTVVTDDPDIALVARAMDCPVTGVRARIVDSVTDATPWTGTARDEAVVAMNRLLGEHVRTRHGGGGATR